MPLPWGKKKKNNDQKVEDKKDDKKKTASPKVEEDKKQTKENGNDKKEPEPEVEEGPLISPEDDEVISDGEKEEKDAPQFYDWKITNFDAITSEKKISDEFVLDDVKWRILLFPYGLKSKSDSLCMYLQCESTTTPNSVVEAAFQLTLINQKDIYKSMERQCYHTFHSNTRDWGFSNVVSRSELKDEGWLVDNSIIIRAEAKVSHRFKRNTRGGGGDSKEDSKKEVYDSKKETGFVGVENQGATCYMNSLLQALYSIAPFRTAVYQLPTQNEQPEESISLALQRVFYKMQFGNTPAGTKELTQSFGWGRSELFVQHDVQELNRVFCDNLENKMKGTISEGMIEKLFRGKIYNYIKCTNVDFESHRTEPFYDVSLNVKGCKDLKASLDDYISTELLSGDNKYDAGDHGLQEAKKGCFFTSLPPVLEFHLKRFVYDPMTDKNCKINDRYEYPHSINMTPYFKPGTTHATKPLYRLYAVLVHVGDLHGGHYYAYLRPTIEPKWYKFDDEKVTRVHSNEVFEQHFGGRERMFKGLTAGMKSPSAIKKAQREAASSGKDGKESKNRPSERTANAYMLFYILDSERESLLGKVHKEDVPVHLEERFAAEEAAEATRRQELAEAAHFMPVKIVTVADLAKHRGFDLIKFETIPPISVRRTSTLEQLKAQIDPKTFGIDPSAGGKLTIRFWNWCKRKNHTLRPDTPYTKEHDEIQQLTKKKLEGPLQLWAEWNYTPSPFSFTEHAPNEDAVIFFKFYDPKLVKETMMDDDPLSFVCYLFVKVNSKIEDVIPRLKQIKQIADDHDIALYEEIKPSMIEPVIPTNTWTEAELSNGDIICFTEVVPGQNNNVSSSNGNKEEEEAKTTAAGTNKEGGEKDNVISNSGGILERAMGVREYYDYMRNRVLVKFIKLSPTLLPIRDKKESNNNNKENKEETKDETKEEKDKDKEGNEKISNSTALILMRTMKYQEVVIRLGDALHVNPMQLRLYGQQAHRDLPKPIPIHKKDNPLLINMLSYTSSRHNNNNNDSEPNLSSTLYFEPLAPYTIDQVENNRYMTVHWYDLSVKLVSTLRLLVSNDSKLEELAEQVKKNHGGLIKGKEFGGSGKIRFLTVVNGKIYKMWKLGDKMSTVPDNVLRAEEIPFEEEQLIKGGGKGEKGEKLGDKIMHIVHVYTERGYVKYCGVPFRFVVKGGEKWEETKKRMRERMGVGEEEFGVVGGMMVTVTGRTMELKDEDVVVDRITESITMIALEHKAPRSSKKEVGIVIRK
eukprot:TRINITY_DN11203_c0_g1_i1.p1 TRINITY_DN11203_c0_g1~~TRINITY_DN11203_c0_g1_i1.p1  ORF type:complete len:1256 (-),score=407.98 TRINITY_DN11203_c0_g1_i1:170-3937(-)